jgi:hypothetical protein
MDFFWFLIIVSFCVVSIIGLFKGISLMDSSLQKYLLDFWSYKEMRWMVAACVIVYFLSVSFPNNLETNNHPHLNNHNFHFDLNHKVSGSLSHNLSGTSYGPISVEVKNR